MATICEHMNISEHITNRYMATLEEPAEDVGFGICDHCGEKFELGEYPEYSNVKQVSDMEEDEPFDDDYDLLDFPEL